MANKRVAVPCAGWFEIDLIDVGDDLEEEEYIAIAMERIDFNISATGEYQDSIEVFEFNLHEHIVKGNVCYADVIEASVEDID